MKNCLYYGDNSEFFRNRGYCPDECVDSIYFDSPFISDRNYNALFKLRGEMIKTRTSERERQIAAGPVHQLGSLRPPAPLW